MKQIAIFLLPLYLAWMWRHAPAVERVRRTGLALGAMLLAPLLVLAACDHLAAPRPEDPPALRTA